MESEENQEIRLLNLLKPIPVPTSRDISMLDQLKALCLVISKTMLFRTMYIIVETSLCCNLSKDDFYCDFNEE